MQCTVRYFVIDNLQKANSAMGGAYDMISKLNEKNERKQKELDLRCTQAKEKVETLKQTIAVRDKTIQELRNTQVCLL